MKSETVFRSIWRFPANFILILVALSFLLYVPTSWADDATPTPGANDAAPTPNALVSFLSIAQIHEAAGHYKTAATYYIKALELEPTNDEASAGLQRTLTLQNLSDPRISIADAYAAANQHQKALDLYLAILADYPEHTDVRQRAEATAPRLDDFWPSQLRTIGVAIIAPLALLALLFLLWTIARFIRWVRQKTSATSEAELTRYVILPFRNGSGQKSLDGLEEGVRSVIANWLRLKPVKSVNDHHQVITLPELPDVGIVSKIVNWWIKQATPQFPQTYVDGILLPIHQANGQRLAGLTIRLRNQPQGEFTKVLPIWCEAAEGLESGAYLSLAYAGASWVYDPTQPMYPEAARILHQSHNLIQIALSESAPSKAIPVLMNASQLAANAQKKQAEAHRDDGAGLAAGAADVSMTSLLVTSDLAAKDQSLVDEYLKQLEQQK